MKKILLLLVLNQPLFPSRGHRSQKPIILSPNAVNDRNFMKYINRMMVFLIINVFIIINSWGQKITNDIIKPTDPNVASFNKYIEHPVNTYNGSADISIPVYTIKDNKIVYPIALRYNSSGITVSEEASWVGLGWNLDVGGYIQQNIIGEQDISTYFQSAEDDLNPGEIYRCKSHVPTLDELNNYVQTLTNIAINRVKPDIFTYSFLGHSGKFFIDYRDGTIHLIKEDEALKIETYKENNTTVWKITDEDGAQYFFNKIGQTWNNAGETSSITYYLSEIIFSNGQRMDFLYKNYNVIAKTQPLWWINYFGYFNEAFFLDNDHTNYNYGGQILQYNAFTLDKIITDNIQVVFETGPRDDIDGGYKLNSITVQQKNNTSVQRKFNFDYDYFISQVEGNYWQGSLFNLQTASRRLKLNSFYEEGNSNKYEFTYYSPNLPIKTSFAVDYWGYYNGQIDNNTLLPRLNYMNSVDKTGISLSVQTSGANRAFNPEVANACMLNSIKYPTKGRTSFQYEPHTFSPFILPTVQEIKNSDIFSQPITESISDHNYEANTTYCFDILSDSQVGIEENIIKGLNTWQEMIGSKVHIVKIIGSSVTNIDIWELAAVPTGNPDYIHNQFLQTLTPGHYCVTVDLPNALGNNYDSWTKHGCVSAAIYIPPQVLPTSIPKFSKGGGLRIKNVQHYDSDATIYPSLITCYDYENKSTGDSYGTLLSKPDPCNVNYNVHYLFSDPDPCPPGTGCNVHDALRNEFEISSNVIKPLSFSNVGGNVAYDRVIEHDENFGAIYTGTSTYPLGYKIYKYNNSNSTTCSGAPVIPNALNGSLWGIDYYDKSNTLIREDIFHFSLTSLHNYYGVHAVDWWNRHPNLYSSSNPLSSYPSCCGIMTPPEYFPGRYGLQFYEVSSYRIRKESEEIKWREGYSQIASYQYNNYGQLKQTSLLKSNGEYKVDNTFYISDYSGSNTDYIDMKDQHIFSPVFERTITNNNKNIYHELNSYTLLGSIESPSTPVKIYGISKNEIAESGGSTYNKTINYEYTDNSFNINLIQEENNIPTSVYWGYNQTLPIAKAINASSNEIFFDSFESSTGWDGTMIYDQTKTHCGRIAGRIDKSTSGESYCHSSNVLNVSLTSTKKFKYSGWIYSNGPSAEIFLFMKSAAETGYYTLVDNVYAGTTGKWVYVEKEYDVPSNITRLFLRVDNNGGGTVWFDDLRLYPSDAQMNTYTYDPLVGMTSSTDENNVSTYYIYDTFGRLQEIKDAEGNVLKHYEYHYTGQPIN